jgi:hypothetical protein
MLKGENHAAEYVEAVRRTVEAQRRVERQRLRARNGRGPTPRTCLSPAKRKSAFTSPPFAYESGRLVKCV